MKHLFIASSIAIAATAWAQSPVPSVKVQDAWARATVGAQSATGAFMKLTAPQATRLVEVRSPAAGIVEVHEMKLDGDVMRMRAVTALPLAAGQTVELKPGGYHVMLMDLKETVKAGQKVRLTLLVKDRKGELDDVDVDVTVKPLHAILQ